MKKTTIMTTSCLLLLFSLFTACDDSESPAPEPSLKQQLSTLSGTYQDPAPYAYGDAFGERTFTFDEGKWTLRFTLALDPHMQMPVFEFRTHGSYSVLEASSTLPNTHNALFLEDRKYLTLKTDNPELIQAFGFSECGLETNVEKDISESGCSLWAPVAVCNEDHDLLSLDADGVLYFGVRPPDNNMCTPDKRPTQLTPGVIKR